MRILVGCERSGRVRDAFKKLGHDAWSCDIEESDAPGQHYKCDVLDVLDEGWDLAIFHPSCQYLSVSGIHWNNRGRGWEETEKALDFVRKLMAAPIDKIAIENPVSIISSRIRKPNFITQPWHHGDPHSKATCFWTKNLPDLVPTNKLDLPESGRWENQTASGQNKLGPSKDRARLRAVTYRGIANAIADQWGKF
jgi:hypothetical protein